jgi:hypothetical protein
MMQEFKEKFSSNILQIFGSTKQELYKFNDKYFDPLEKVTTL